MPMINFKYSYCDKKDVSTFILQSDLVENIMDVSTSSYNFFNSGFKLDWGEKLTKTIQHI